MIQATDQWESFRLEFYRDGSLRDLYVLDTDVEDWRRVANYVAGNCRFEFDGAWRQKSFPADITRLFPTDLESESTILSIDLSGVLANCHFFTPDEIEFDIDPAEVTNSARLAAIFQFMEGLANTLNEDVLLTPENTPEIVIFRCPPRSSQIKHFPFWAA